MRGIELGMKGAGVGERPNADPIGSLVAGRGGVGRAETGRAGVSGAGVGRAGVGRTGVAREGVTRAPVSAIPTGITPLQVEQRARTPPAGTLAGSTR